MPTFVKGNLWDEVGRADLILVTANSTLNSRGELVMGKGAALEAKQRYPWLPGEAGRAIRAKGGSGTYYGALAFPPRLDAPDTDIGILQVKIHWHEPARLSLIELSLKGLAETSIHYTRIALNFPGIGAGQLNREDVLPLLECLPDNVFIYEPEATQNA
jgi:hypothetical protein